MTAPDTLFLAGDSYHDPQIAFRGIGPILEAQGLTVDYITDVHDLSTERLAGKRLFVIHRDGIEFPQGKENPPVPWMQAHQEEALESFVLNGGSFFAIHNSAWGYPWQGGYRRAIGGYYLMHPPSDTFTVKVVNREHPITAGVQDYEIFDEQHWLWHDYDRVTLLLINQGKDGRTSAAGWAYPYGKGRVVFLANGHTDEAHCHPEFMKLKTNAVRWLVSST